MSATLAHPFAAAPRSEPGQEPGQEPGMRHFAALVVAAIAAAVGFSALAADGGRPAARATYVQIDMGGQPAAERLTTILVTPASARTVQ